LRGQKTIDDNKFIKNFLNITFTIPLQIFCKKVSNAVPEFSVEGTLKMNVLL